MPILYFVYRSYRVYLDKLEDEKRHAEDEKRHAQEVAGLHLRTIEALALAIEAKDQATHEHLRRVRTYVEELGKDMHLSDLEMDGLRAAALLHDIGKLAVPEHILSKPGKMTAEEFEKMKIHPDCRRRDSGVRRLPVPRRAHRRGAPREMGRQRLSVRAQRRRDSDRRPHPGGGRLAGRAGIRPPVPPRSPARSGHGADRVPFRKEFRPARRGGAQAALSRARTYGASAAPGETEAFQRSQNRPRPRSRGRARGLECGQEPAPLLPGFHRRGPPGGSPAV